MLELGQLEKAHQQFSERGIAVFVISNDKLDDAKATQADFPHLVIVSDADQNMARALEVIHKGAAADGSDTNAPTTFLVNGQGRVTWLFRPNRFFERLSPADLLDAIDKKLGPSTSTSSR